MTPFESLLVGHLVGDFLFQNDWQAAGKRHNSAVCAAHAGFYFIGLLLVGFLFLPWWAYPAVVLPHFAVDRLGLARRYMAWFGQEKFATGDYKSWSVVAVDQIIHLACIFPVAALCTRAAPDRLDVALFLLVCIVVSPVLWAAAGLPPGEVDPAEAEALMAAVAVHVRTWPPDGNGLAKDRVPTPDQIQRTIDSLVRLKRDAEAGLLSDVKVR